MAKQYINAEIKITPISSNKIWQGRRFKTKEYKKWRQDAHLLLPKKAQIKGKVGVDLVFYIPYPQRCDLDNLLKGTLDAIVDRGYIEDDRFIYQLNTSKVKSDKNKISIQIYELE